MQKGRLLSFPQVNVDAFPLKLFVLNICFRFTNQYWANFRQYVSAICLNLLRAEKFSISWEKNNFSICWEQKIFSIFWEKNDFSIFWEQICFNLLRAKFCLHLLRAKHDSSVISQDDIIFSKLRESRFSKILRIFLKFHLRTILISR